MNFGELPVFASLIIPLLGAGMLFLISPNTNSNSTKWICVSTFLITTSILIADIFYLTNAKYYNIQQYGLSMPMSRLSQFGSIFALIAAIVTVLQLWDHLHQEGWTTTRPLISILISVSGIIMLSTTNNIFLIFLATTLTYSQLRTLTTAVDIRLDVKIYNSQCLLVSAATSAFFLVGSVLIFSATGSFNTVAIGSYMAQTSHITPVMTVGLTSLVLGFMLNLDMLPIVKWTPKIYSAAPHPIPIFMSAAMNGVLILTFLRVMVLNINIFTVLPSIQNLVIILIGISIAWCSIIMLSRNNIKQMLAYSSICHAGYLLLGIVAGTPGAHSGILFHLVTYLVMNIGSFGMLSAFGLVGGEITLDQLKGLGWQKPVLGASVSLCMFSMAGFPPTAGFYGKYMIFKELITKGHFFIAILGLISSLSLIYCCIRVPLALFIEKIPLRTKRELMTKPMVLAPFANATVILCGLITIILGLIPGTILDTFILSITREIVYYMP